MYTKLPLVKKNDDHRAHCKPVCEFQICDCNIFFAVAGKKLWCVFIFRKNNTDLSTFKQYRFTKDENRLIYENYRLTFVTVSLRKPLEEILLALTGFFR